MLISKKGMLKRGVKIMAENHLLHLLDCPRLSHPADFLPDQPCDLGLVTGKL